MSIAEGLAIAVLVLTLVPIAWQARATAHQARSASAAAGANALRGSMTHPQSVLQQWLDRPDLYTYFVEPRPAPLGDDAVRVRMIGEMWADCVGAAIEDNKAVEAFRQSEASWTSYAAWMLSSSLVLYDLVAEHPDWWPELAAIVEYLERPGVGAAAHSDSVLPATAQVPVEPVLDSDLPPA